MHPAWLKKCWPASEEVARTMALLEGLGLDTVCLSAACPNLRECFARRTATFLILGPVCTRNCRFCAVPKGTPRPVDSCEPRRVALAAAELQLRHVVITSVTRDDLPDGGAGQFAATIAAVREALPEATVEVLTPDLKGSPAALEKVVAAGPRVFNHNVETVPRLYPAVRPQADYRRSLELLRRAKEMGPGILTKSGLMVGLGEGEEEVLAVLTDLRAANCDAVTIGQYLCPSPAHLPVREYLTPQAFARYRARAIEMGFRYVASGPFVRSSYLADVLLRDMR